MSTGTCPSCGFLNKAGAAFCAHCGIELRGQAMAYVPLQPGQALKGGAYRVVRPLGKGGMGAVYLATQTLAGQQRYCVIKEMLDYVNRSDFPTPQLYEEAVRKAQQRFQEEAATLVELNHPGIPQIYDYFSEGGRNYIAMQFIEGENLEKRLSHMDDNRRWVQGSAQPAERVIPWGIQLCRVLEYLASRQPPLVHHDIKPANIILDKATGDVRLVDFGTAKAKLKAQAGGQLGLRKSSIYGTAGYAAPEMYPPRSESSPLSDVYSLGATLYHLLTDDDPRNHPFHYPKMAGLPPHVRQVLEQALEADPQRRINAAQMRQELEAALGKAAPFYFRNGEVARDTVELAELCDRCWEDAKYHFYRGDFENWLRVSLHRTDLEAKAAEIRQKYSDRDQGLEALIHLLDDRRPVPSAAVDRRQVNLGHMLVGEVKRGHVLVKNAAGRGHLSGRVRADPPVPWLSAPDAFAGESTLEIEVNAAGQAEGTTLATTLLLETEYGPPIRIPVRAKVAFGWGRFLFDVLSTVVVSGGIWFTLVHAVRRALASGLGDDFDRSAVTNALVGGALLAVLIGFRRGSRRSFSGLGCLLGAALGFALTGYVTLALSVQLRLLGNPGTERLTLVGLIALGAFVGLVLGLYRGLRHARRPALAIVVPAGMLACAAFVFVSVGKPRLYVEPYPFTDPLIPVVAIAPRDITPSPPPPRPTPMATLARTPTRRPSPATLTPTPGFTRMFVIANIAANVRSSPSDKGDVVGRAPRGTAVYVYAKQGEWYKVRCDDPRLEGWVHESLLSDRRP